MSRKHFEALAAEIRIIANYEARKAAAEAVATACRKFNPLFSAERFFAACGVK